MCVYEVVEKCIAISAIKQTNKGKQNQITNEKRGNQNKKVIKKRHHSVYRLFRTCDRTSPRDISLIRLKKPNMVESKKTGV